VAALYRLWTRKEAWVKAVSGETMLSLGEADVLHDLPGLWFRDMDLPGNCAAAVCAGEEEICPPETITGEELIISLAV
jgi:phosphopantetheinyl transferase